MKEIQEKLISPCMLLVFPIFLSFNDVSNTCKISNVKVQQTMSENIHVGCLKARLHTGKFSSDKKISFVLNPLVAHGSSQNKEKLPVQGKFSCV